MHSTSSRRTALRTGLAGSLSLIGLSARACEFYASTLRVTHPWTRATADGETSAIVCMKFDEVQQDERLIGIETAIATAAELGGLGAQPQVDFAIPQGRESHLSEGGTYLRLTGLNLPLETGRAYPMRLQFATAGWLRADLTVDFARFR